jgi:hypothetical protein
VVEVVESSSFHGLKPRFIRVLLSTTSFKKWWKGGGKWGEIGGKLVEGNHN